VNSDVTIVVFPLDSISIQFFYKQFDFDFLLIATYGCESWTVRKNLETRPDAFEMKGLRKILRVSWTVEKTSEWVLNKAGVKWELLDTQSKEASILRSHHEETRELPGERCKARCTQARKTMHGLDGQHQYMDRMTEDRDKWRKYVHGEANPLIEDNWRAEQCVVLSVVQVWLYQSYPNISIASTSRCHGKIASTSIVTEISEITSQLILPSSVGQINVACFQLIRQK